jgi:hypothetical protein
VRERLKVETGRAAATLWCVLGDLHDDAEFYRKAWEVTILSLTSLHCLLCLYTLYTLFTIPLLSPHTHLSPLSLYTRFTIYIPLCSHPYTLCAHPPHSLYSRFIRRVYKLTTHSLHSHHSLCPLPFTHLSVSLCPLLNSPGVQAQVCAIAELPWLVAHPSRRDADWAWQECRITQGASRSRIESLYSGRFVQRGDCCVSERREAE